MKKVYYVSFTFGASIRVEAESEDEAEDTRRGNGDQRTHGPRRRWVRDSIGRRWSNPMPIINVPVQFSGVVTVQVPDRFSPDDAKLLATKLALARILATTDNPDGPEEDACFDYADECSAQAWMTREADWDRCEISGVSGSWTTT